MVHHLTVLQGQLRYAKQDKLLELLARHMPDDVWLDRIEIDSAGHATLKGTSFGDEGVFEFVRWLSDAPGVTRVQLEGTTAAQLATAACTKFEVKFDVIQDSTVKGGVNSTNESDS
jgi:Tfp pilus assembly protein PilN